jgi:glutamate dehydrogenase
MQLSPSDPWERLLVAGLARDFQQMRLDTIGRLKGDDAEAAIGKWLDKQAVRVAQFRTFIDRARAMPAPSPAMLAQLAGQARTLLAR